MTPRSGEEIYPAVLRAAARVSVVVRCARGIDDRGLHVTNIEALSQRAGAAAARGRGDLPRRRLLAARAARCRTGRVVEGDGDQRRDRRRLGDRQGHPRPLHARRRRAAPGLGLRGARRLLDPRAPRRRSSGSASRRCTAARSSRSPTRQLELGRLTQKAPRDVLDRRRRGPARSKVTPTASKRISA